MWEFEISYNFVELHTTSKKTKPHDHNLKDRALYFAYILSYEIE